MARKGLLPQQQPPEISNEPSNKKRKSDKEDGQHTERGHRGKTTKGTDIDGDRDANNVRASESEATIYQQAIPRSDSIDNLSNLIISNIEKLRNRVSSSSDEMQNTSDESELDLNTSIVEFSGKRTKTVEDNQRPHTSRDEPRSTTREMDERREQLLRDAERNKTKAYEIAGKNQNLIREIENSRIQAVLIDEEYLAMGSHLESSIRMKIEAGEYVDLARLLPRDRVNNEEDH